ncbi:hypothetical protein Tco_0856574 [Tanacetum coccineum]|uniref:CCHC-type domain-containing protein n=1 Tax=Tanacetum coccineum TaxID=301880 RepID=A0ABQ5B6F7_9ASTR
MVLYMQNRENGRIILESVKHGPLIWPTIEENRVTRTKKYAELSATEKIQADCDLKATNIILQDFGLAVHVFKQGDDPIDAINKMISFLSTVVTSRFPSTNNQLRNSSNPRQQATIHDGRVTVQPLKGRQNFYVVGTSGTRANTLGTGGNYSDQQRVVKCFNCQGEGHIQDSVQSQREKDATWSGKQFYWSKLKEMLKQFLWPILSSYGPDVLSEVPISENTNNDMLNQSVQEMPYSEPSHFVEHPENEIHSDSNIISYSQYLIESQNAAVRI